MSKVYFVNGFMDAGKTTFIQTLIEEAYFKIDKTTLLVVCEDGDVEYDDYLMDNLNVQIRYIEDPKDFNAEHLAAIESEVKPARTIIEYNGMWSNQQLDLPWYWDDIMHILIIDGATFEMYSKNMKAQLSEKIKESYMAVVNNCDSVMDKLANFRRNIRAANPNINVVFRDKEGEELNIRFDEDLPYNINDEVINIVDDQFSTFYIDSMENPDRYVGKRVKFIAQVKKPSDGRKGVFLATRQVMTCCINDLSLFGIICDFDGADYIEENSWVEIEGTIQKEFFEKYNVEAPICNVSRVKACSKPEKEIIDVI